MYKLYMSEVSKREIILCIILYCLCICLYVCCSVYVIYCLCMFVLFILSIRVEKS